MVFFRIRSTTFYRERLEFVDQFTTHYRGEIYGMATS